jgi:serine protease AprX
VAGLAALLIQQYPTATPDQIKAMLKANARPLKPTGAKSWYAGSGSADVGSFTSSTPLPVVVPQIATATGVGTLEGARGTYHLISGGVPLQGEVDIFGKPWVAGVMAPLTEARATWSGGTWNGTEWTGGTFMVDTAPLTPETATWAGARWSGVRWSGVRWSSPDWSGVRWSSVQWDGVRWSGVRWSDMSWDGVRWSGVRWSGVRWSAGGWDGVRWSDYSWS